MRPPAHCIASASRSRRSGSSIRFSPPWSTTHASSSWPTWPSSSWSARRDGSPFGHRAARRTPSAEAGGDGDDDALRFIDPAHAVGRLAAPLQRGGHTIGLLVVGSGSARTFGVDDVEALSSLANQAAIAIENAHLQERLRELAVIAERERIAREMHDGLAQVLGYVNTKSQAVDEYLGDRPGGRGPRPAGRALAGCPLGLRRRPRGDPRPAQPDRGGGRASWARSRSTRSASPRLRSWRSS